LFFSGKQELVQSKFVRVFFLQFSPICSLWQVPPGAACTAPHVPPRYATDYIEVMSPAYCAKARYTLAIKSTVADTIDFVSGFGDKSATI